jgi:hypothetical protein
MAQERHQPEHQSDSELASELTPTHSEARVRRPGVSVPSDRPEGRISVRPTPTPFGRPRPGSAHPAVQTAAGLGPANTPRPGSVPPASLPAPKPPASFAPPATSETKSKPALPAQPDFRAEGEELVPLPDVTQSLPSIPLAAMLPLRELAAPAESGGRTLLQIGAFAIVLAASVVSVLRYAGVLGVSAAPVSAEASSASPLVMAIEPAAPPLPRTAVAAPVARAALPAAAGRLAGDEPAPAAEPAPVAQDPVTAEVERIVASLAGLPAGRADALVDAADRALGRGEERLAETLLGRALKIDEKHPRAAYTLARVRFAQNNLEGAEGWVLVAIRARPRVVEYHSLYADILAKQGHSSHARRERHKARNLAR